VGLDVGQRLDCLVACSCSIGVRVGIGIGILSVASIRRGREDRVYWRIGIRKVSVCIGGGHGHQAKRKIKQQLMKIWKSEEGGAFCPQSTFFSVKGLSSD